MLTFWHRYALEHPLWDGGEIEISVNSGPWATVTPATISPPYPAGTLPGSFSNPLVGKQGWTNKNPSWPLFDQVTVNLAGNASPGQTVRFRFRLGTDRGNAGLGPSLGWWIDDIRVTGPCNTPTPTATRTPTPTATPPCGSGLLVVAGQTTGFGPHAWGATLAQNDVDYTWAAGSASKPIQKFAVVQDHDPWGTTPNRVKNAINVGHSFDPFTPSDLDPWNANLDNYRVIVLNFDDHWATQLTAYDANAITHLQSYIAGGGVVWYQLAAQSGTYALPFGGTAVYDLETNNFPPSIGTHPLTLGMSSPFTGYYASHYTFGGLPAGAQVIAHADWVHGWPTLYTYSPAPCNTPTPTATSTPTATATVPPGPTPPCAPTPGGMTHWYPLDELSGPTAHENVGGRNGTWQGGPVPNAGQYVGNSLSFNGAQQWVGVPAINSPAFGSGDFSIERLDQGAGQLLERPTGVH